MKIDNQKIKVRDLVEDYTDLGDDGVFAYSHRLTVRPAYQREFVYNDKQREAVIDTIFKGFPLNSMYWNRIDDNAYEVLDGQQRTISICQYYKEVFAYNDKFFKNLPSDLKDKFLDYELDVHIVEGSDSEKLDWFRIINTQGEVLTNQELLNAAYTGPFLSEAKIHFSKRSCPALNLGDGYISGNPIRQQLLEQVLKWISNRDGLENHALYMGLHQNDPDDNDLWQYYQQVMNWAKMLFQEEPKLTRNQEWGLLYNKYKNNSYNTNKLKQDLDKLILDDDVTSKSGIIPYLLSDRSKADEKHLSLRTFTPAQKIKLYKKQNGICPECGKDFKIEEMEADHIIPWHDGGKTKLPNGQMLCRSCNCTKGGK